MCKFCHNFRDTVCDFGIYSVFVKHFPLHYQISWYRSSLPRDVFCKKVFLNISQNSQENTYVTVSFLIKLQARPVTLFKNKLWHWCFPVNFVRFLRIPFLLSISSSCFWWSRRNRLQSSTSEWKPFSWDIITWQSDVFRHFRESTSNNSSWIYIFHKKIS